MKKPIAMILALAAALTLLCAAVSAETVPVLPEEGWVADSINGTVWQDDRASLEVIPEDEGFKVLIMWGSSAWEMTEWVYACSYDAETQTLTASFAVCDNVLYDDDGNVTRTNVFEQESEAVFSLNEDGKVVILNAGDDALEGKMFERLEIDIGE